MEFTATEFLQFVKETEDPEDFVLLVIGKEREGYCSKAALLNTKTWRIILRTATMLPGTTTRKSYDTHNPDWKVETSLFNADKEFWNQLKKHEIFKVDEIPSITTTPLVDYPMSDDDSE